MEPAEGTRAEAPSRDGRTDGTNLKFLEKSAH